MLLYSEYLRRIQIRFSRRSKRRSYSKKKLAQITSVDASIFVPITRQKGKNENVQCDFLKRYIIENNDDDRVINIFALVVYDTLIFSQSPGYVNTAVVDLIK